jgi:hypothetical protein
MLQELIDGHRHNFIDQNFWDGGYFVSTVDRNEDVIHNYIETQKDTTSLRLCRRLVDFFACTTTLNLLKKGEL